MTFQIPTIPRIKRATRTFALLAQIIQISKTHGHEIQITSPAIPVTPTPIGHWDSNWQNKNVQRVDYEATHTTTVKRKEKENFTAKDVTGTHTVIPPAQGATPAPPDSKTKAFTHPGQITTQFHQQSQATTTTTQGHHQHHPVLEALLTSPRQFMTFLDENRQQAKLLEYRKELLATYPSLTERTRKHA